MLITVNLLKTSGMDTHYSEYYSEKSLFEKIRRFSVKAGQKVVYAVLLLYYLMKDPGVGIKTKMTIAAALGYFILPADVLPDLVPLLGYTDDLGVLVFVLVQVSRSLTPAIRQQARQKLAEWFRKVDEKQLLALEEKIGDQT